MDVTLGVFDVNGSVPESLQEKVVEVDTALLDRPEPHTKRPLIEVLSDGSSDSDDDTQHS
jgi:hypothetical protein